MDKYRRTSEIDLIQPPTAAANHSAPEYIYCQSAGKVRSYLGAALQKLQTHGRLVVVGRGGGIQNAITVAELVKRKSQSLHQLNRMGTVSGEDVWEPVDSQLDAYVPIDPLLNHACIRTDSLLKI